MKRAYRLYVQHKTETPEYREIAARLGLTVWELNLKINAIYSQRKFAKRP